MTTTFKDLVCDMYVAPEVAAGKSEYKGETYYFCSPGCKRIFDNDPEKYLNQVEGVCSQSSLDDLQTTMVETACGGKLTGPTNYPSAMYRGKQIYFCNRACLRAFEENPDLFMAGEIEHPLNDE